MAPRASLCAALAATALAVPVATAHGAATIARFTFTTPFTDTIGDDCRPGVTGAVTGTDVLVGQIVGTPSGGSMFSGVDTSTVTIAFSDGSTGVGGTSFRFGGPQIAVGADISAATFRTSQSVTVSDASGQVIGTETSHDIEHVTAEDLPPAGPSDNDIVHVSFEHGHLDCGGVQG